MTEAVSPLASLFIIFLLVLNIALNILWLIDEVGMVFFKIRMQCLWHLLLW